VANTCKCGSEPSGSIKCREFLDWLRTGWFLRKDSAPWSNNNNNNNNNNTRGKLDNKQWYDHVSKSVEMSHEGKVTILWNQQVRTDRTIPNNKLDIIIHDNKKAICMLIDAAIPGDRNVIKNELKRF
jgi:hypothetical protein